MPIASYSSSSAGTNSDYMGVKLIQNIMALFDRYYDEIISLISDADSIWIFGLGQLKEELENRLKQKGFGARIVGIETAEKMNDQQISAIVREHFLRKRNTWELFQDLKNR